MSSTSMNTSTFLDLQRYAVVTGANKGIGLEICRQLASEGIMVVLTARDENKGQEAVQKLKSSGLSDDLVIFHQLDVVCTSSIYSLADFVKSRFGKLDILVNNAAVAGVIMDITALRAEANDLGPSKINWINLTTQSYNLAEECLETNYYGAKRMVEAFMPLLQLSNSPRIVNVSSSTGLLKFVLNEWAIGILSDVETLSEERVDEILHEFLKDFKQGDIEARTWPWPSVFSAYTLSKAAMNAYTRILANKYPSLLVNSVCPGFVNTDMNGKIGTLTVEEGATSPVTLALLPEGGPAGIFFAQMKASPF